MAFEVLMGKNGKSLFFNFLFFLFHLLFSSESLLFFSWTKSNDADGKIATSLSAKTVRPQRLQHCHLIQRIIHTGTCLQLFEMGDLLPVFVSILKANKTLDGITCVFITFWHRIVESVIFDLKARLEGCSFRSFVIQTDVIFNRGWHLRFR